MVKKYRSAKSRAKGNVVARIRTAIKKRAKRKPASSRRRGVTRARSSSSSPMTPRRWVAVLSYAKGEKHGVGYLHADGSCGTRAGAANFATNKDGAAAVKVAMKKDRCIRAARIVPA